MEEKWANHIVDGADDKFGFPILRGRVWTGESKGDAVWGKEVMQLLVVEFPIIITLETLDWKVKLSFNICVKLDECWEDIRFELDREDP